MPRAAEAIRALPQDDSLVKSRGRRTGVIRFEDSRIAVHAIC